MANPQSRKWSLVTYLSPSQIAELLSIHGDKIRAYAYATHDKDVNEDGTVKESHTHIILWLNKPNTATTVRNWFRAHDANGVPVNTLAQPCADIVSMYRYLTHKDNLEKVQYSDDILFCSDPSCFEEDVQTDSVYSAVEDLLNGIPLREVARRYGRDFIYHYSHIRTLVNDILAEEK